MMTCTDAATIRWQHIVSDHDIINSNVVDLWELATSCSSLAPPGGGDCSQYSPGSTALTGIEVDLFDASNLWAIILYTLIIIWQQRQYIIIILKKISSGVMLVYNKQHLYIATEQQQQHKQQSSGFQAKRQTAKQQYEQQYQGVQSYIPRCQCHQELHVSRCSSRKNREKKK